MAMRSVLQLDQFFHQLNSLRGEYVWNVQCINDHILQLEFGEPHLVVHEPGEAKASMSQRAKEVFSRRVVLPAGAFHMLVEDGFWEVTAGNLSCGRDTVDNGIISLCLSQLSGQKLLAIIFDDVEKSCVFRFDLSGELIIKGEVSRLSDSSQWSVYFKNGEILSFISQNETILER